MNIVCIALGGALGAVLRYFISLIPYKSEFPLLTLATNVIGAVIIGFVAGYASRKGMHRNVLLFLKTGFCGGFTTFSTFSLEALMLVKSGKTVTAVIYMCLSAVLCITGVFIGMWFGEKN
ncbi:MAG: fluoride efflux transporter CrcB [Parasporobacterium sp.]|nr:fluoride efflux transporter CrcB [Parasporobacterium sp.]